MQESETRRIIDEYLRQAGWEADTENLRYSKGTRPVKGRNLAIAEWPLSSSDKKGFADYVLFAGLQMLGVIEAKASHKDVISVLDYQCREYAGAIRGEDSQYQTGIWGKYQVPFVFATNGREYVRQIQSKSGIWFLDLRNSSNTPMALHGWPSPAGLTAWFNHNIQAGNRALQAMPYDLITDEAGLNLRDYQVRAIKAAEKAVIDGRQTALLAMATGTGKTRTVLGMIYRFLKSGRFRRILFLVDRNSLGQQAQDVFQEVKLEDLMPLTKIYSVKGLEDGGFDLETRVHIATVQSMVKRILYNEGSRKPSVSDYDLIIVDEAHRGYLLDREMSEAEQLYRDQLDYQSKYRHVLDYFEAVKIALTATPALQTTEIFGLPVFKYTYREAVIEGWLVDHDAPHFIKTKLNVEGIHYKPGDTINLFTPETAIQEQELLDDELDFDVDAFNRSVITENFNRAVLEEIALGIDPANPDTTGKTLIYAVNDQHADMIVAILRDIYSQSGLDHEAIMKITGKAGDGNPRRIQDAIKRFKNERFPSVVVTVDLLTTGIDVPEITTLVFLRRVKSRILFEQMIGRATRLCPKIHKTHFEIYDPVGVYTALAPVNTMKPVVVNPSSTFTQLLEGLETVNGEEPIREQIAQIIAKLQRVKGKVMDSALEQFKSLSSGLTPDQFIKKALEASPDEAKDYLLSHRELFLYLQDNLPRQEHTVVISHHPDEVTGHERTYGEGIHRPEDYLDAFTQYVQNNRNTVAALNIVCTRPRDLTRETLKELRLNLEREGFTVPQLNTALSQMTNHEITADIISLIRRYAIGEGAMPPGHEERICTAVARLKKAHDFSPQELSWLGRIEEYLMNESIFNVAVFDEDERFKSAGGFDRINKVFCGILRDVIDELNDYLYDDGGEAA